MKVVCRVFVGLMAIFSQTALFGGSADAWERLLVSAEGEILWVGSPSGGQYPVYAGTGEGLFMSQDSGVTWKKADVPSEVKDVSMGVFDGKDIHFIAGGGLYIGKDDEWKRSSGLSGLEGVCAMDKGDEESAILAWSRKKLYIVLGEGIQEIGSASLWPVIDDVVSCDDRIYVVSGSNVFMSENNLSGWKKIELYPGEIREEVSEHVLDAVEPEEGPSEYSGETGPTVRSRISIAGENSMIIATANGIYRFAANGEVTEFVDTAGLPSCDLRFSADSPRGLLAATGEKVFMYSKVDKTWTPVFEPAGEGRINYFFVGKTDTGEGRLWTAVGASLYCGAIAPPREESSGIRSVREKCAFNAEPSIVEVQKMAIEYAEVSPKKIEAWRSAAKWKAVMPKLSVDFGQDRDDNVELYTSATNCYSYVGPEERSDGWDVGLQWDLSDLVWNEAQTSIDVRSKLMVQLRNDILQEVTRLYFERKRILTGAGMNGTGKGRGKGKQGMEHGAWSEEEREIRVQELTAHIDALTGGKFSEAIASARPQN
jgi:hypothetical protein